MPNKIEKINHATHGWTWQPSLCTFVLQILLIESVESAQACRRLFSNHLITSSPNRSNRRKLLYFDCIWGPKFENLVNWSHLTSWSQCREEEFASACIHTLYLIRLLSPKYEIFSQFLTITSTKGLSTIILGPHFYQLKQTTVDLSL
jgi:hypothetical protein